METKFSSGLNWLPLASNRASFGLWPLTLACTLAIGWPHCFCIGEHEFANSLANDIKKFDFRRRSSILDCTKKFRTQYRMNQIT